MFKQFNHFKRKEDTMKSAGMVLVLTVMFVLWNVALAQEGGQMAGGAPSADAKLGKSVVDRELSEETSTFSVGDRVYLWLRVTGAAGDSITVTWTHEEHSYQVKLGIGGSPWRTWAYKTAAYPGSWSVSVTDSEGHVLKEMNFTVEEMGMQPPPPPKQ